MKSYRTRLLFLGVVLLAVAGLAMNTGAAKFWDGYFTNALVRGVFTPGGFVNVKPVALTYTTGQGYLLSGATKGVVFDIPIDTAAAKAATDKCPVAAAKTGITVVVTRPTPATHGRIYGIRNTSGTTPFVLYAGGIPVQTTSGTTRAGCEDVGDIMWVQESYNTGISLYVLSEFTND